jgi:membrane fusion protein, heavy metal efflux system
MTPMSTSTKNFPVGAVVAAALAAAVIGFLVARFTVPSPASAPAAGERPKADALAISDESLATMGIALETVQAAGNLIDEIQVSALVAPGPNGQAVVTARAPGTLTRLNKVLGQDVATGEVLALVESREAAAMAAERATAESNVALARSTLNRERSLFEQKITPRQDLETAEATLAAAEAEAVRARAAASAAGVASDGRSLALTSPIAGRITAVKAALGAYLEPGAEIFRVADPRFVVIEAAVPALDARRVALGDRAEVTTGAGEKLTAVVNAVTPTLNEQTRAASVTLALAAGQKTPSPGEVVLARITTKSASATGFVIPDEAVQIVDGKNVVFVRRDGQLRVTPVVVTLRNGGRASIASGVQAGDVIATTNAFLLKAELGKGADEEE